MQAGIAHIKKELAGIYPETEIDAFTSVILQHIKSYSRTQILLARYEQLSESERQRVDEITSRLKKHEPIQYILGETEFYGLTFRCRPGVLIPRPETEELVDWILKESGNSEISILDIGTGTGCIPVSLKKNLPEATVLGCDISEICLALATENANLNGLDVSFFKLDILQYETTKALPVFDLLVSNPPYVRNSEKALMETNVLGFEPELALFVADDDPLLFYRAIVRFADDHLKAGGEMYWEINEALAFDCIQLLTGAGYQNVKLRKDIHDKDRMISAQKP